MGNASSLQRKALPAALLAVVIVFLRHFLERRQKRLQDAPQQTKQRASSSAVPVRYKTAAPPRQEQGTSAAVLPPRPTRPPPRTDASKSSAPPRPPMKAPPLPVDFWIALDFEWTCDTGLQRRVRGDDVEIIEFAFVLWDMRTSKVVSEGQYYCKNERTPITDFCTELTGISDETLEGKGSLVDALQRFEKVLAENNVAEHRCCAVVHGSADLELVLPLHCSALGVKVPQVLKRYVDLRLATQRHLHKKGDKKVRASSLKQICTALHVEQVGREHCGLDDARMVLQSLQELLKANADLKPVDFMAGREAFLMSEPGMPEHSVLCLDGLPFFTSLAELGPWLENLPGCKDGYKEVLLVFGMDGRPSQRAVVNFGSHEQALQVLEATPHGRLLEFGQSEDSHSERLILIRPLRREEWELPRLQLDYCLTKGEGPALVACPEDAQVLKNAARGVCFAFQRGDCTKGDACRYAHEIMAGQAPLPLRRSMMRCFAFEHDMCLRGNHCCFQHGSPTWRRTNGREE